MRLNMQTRECASVLPFNNKTKESKIESSKKKSSEQKISAYDKTILKFEKI